MKTLVGTALAISIFVGVALAFDSQYKTRLITSATLTIHVKDGQYIVIRNFTQDQNANQRGVIVAAVIPSTPTPTAAPTPTPTPMPPFISTQPGPAVALSTGDKLTDSATLFGFNNPTGTIDFSLQDPTNLVVYTDQVTVSGNNTYSTATGTNPGGYTPTVTGTYTWAASYSGDSNNPAAIETGETEIVTATPTPAPTAAPTPTPINAVVLAATIQHPPPVSFPFQHPLPTEYLKPIIISGPATLTIDPVPPATLVITYRKGLQPIQPTPTPTAAAASALSSTSSSFSTSKSASTSTTTRSTTVTLSDDDEIEWSTPSLTPTPTATASPRRRAATPTPTPTAIPSVAPTVTPTPMLGR